MIEGTEYDFLEWLYAKDQEGKIIQLHKFPCVGMSKNVFTTYSFVPPTGTTLITPYACFKICGVWKGISIRWNPEAKNEAMDWFSTMGPEARAQLADLTLLTGKLKNE